MNQVNCIDTDLLDEYLIKYSVGHDDIKTRKCFYLSELTKLIFFSDRFSSEDLKKIRDNNIEYLSKTAWGNLIINNSDNYFFVKNYEYDYNDFCSIEILNRERCKLILNGMIKFYNEYEQIKERIYSITGIFPNINMLIYYIIGNCSIENYMDNKNYKTNKDNLLDTCKNIYEKIKNDIYWENLLKKRNEKMIIKKEQDKIQAKKDLDEEIGWYKEEMKKRKI